MWVVKGKQETETSTMEISLTIYILMFWKEAIIEHTPLTTDFLIFFCHTHIHVAQNICRCAEVLHIFSMSLSLYCQLASQNYVSEKYPSAGYLLLRQFIQPCTTHH